MHQNDARMMPTSTDRALFEKAIEGIIPEAGINREKPGMAIIDLFHTFSIPTALQQFLIANSFNKPFKVGRIYYNRTNEMAATVKYKSGLDI